MNTSNATLIDTPADEDGVCLSLVPLTGAEFHEPIIVDSVPFTAGANRRCSLSIQSGVISGVHAELGQSRQGFWVRDLSSTNGTFVNGRRIAQITEICDGDRVQFGDVVFQVQSTAVPDNGFDEAFDLIVELEQFDRLMSQRLVEPSFDPVVSLYDGQVIGLEVLARSELLGLKTPKEMFTAAAKLNLESELSRLLRWEGVVHAQNVHPQFKLFLNTHSDELGTPEFLDSVTQVRDLAPSRPIIAEIPEQGIDSEDQLSQLIAELDDLEVEVCVDDFAADMDLARRLIATRPVYAKFDMSITGEIAQQNRASLVDTRQLIVEAKAAGIKCVAKGIESPQMLSTCNDIGFDFGQGYYFGTGR